MNFLFFLDFFSFNFFFSISVDSYLAESRLLNESNDRLEFLVEQTVNNEIALSKSQEIWISYNKWEFVSFFLPKLEGVNNIWNSDFKENYANKWYCWDYFNTKWRLTNHWDGVSEYLFWVLASPLIFAFLTVLLYAWSLYKNIFFGEKFKIEKKTINFSTWSYNKFKNLYMTMFILYPWLTSSFFINFPNPTHLFNTFFVFFPKKFEYFWWHFWFFWMISFLLFFNYYTNDFWYNNYVEVSNYDSLFFLNKTSLVDKPIFIFFCTFMATWYPFLFKTTVWLRIEHPFDIGLWLWSYFVKWGKPSSGHWVDIDWKTYVMDQYSTFPLWYSLIHFLSVNVILSVLYLYFFFWPIFLWNGYFLQSINEFFFYTWYNSGNEKSQIFADFISFNKESLMFDYFFGLDGLNIWMLWLTSLLVFLCALFLWDNQKNDTFFSQMGWIFLLQFASIQFFCVANYFWMYVFFELSLLPIYVLIVYWGSNRWKIHAAYQMVLFTFIGSIFLLAGIFIIYLKVHTFNLMDIVTNTSLPCNISSSFSIFEKKLIWICMFIGFAVKTPLYPFHIWLPEAHSEAPTTGSVLLAGVLLKMGTYGFMWFVMPLFPELIDFYKTIIFTMCVCGVLLSSLAALAQIDIKKIIAYSSIGHMGLVILGLCTLDKSGLIGSCFMMLSHGLVSGALFFSIGLLYKIYGTRSILHYSTIAHFMPKFAMCFYIFILANMGFPGTAGFPAEVLIFSSIVGENFFITLFAGLGSIICGTYSIWLLTWVLYGQINLNITLYWDLKPIEWKVVGCLGFLVLLFGIFPYLILDFFKPFCTVYEITNCFTKFVL